jgi:eukaryotic-like serine/threonine-protein kinase
VTDEATPAPSLAAGTVVAERYRVESVIGHGGMGVVYLAQHVHMRKAFALKVLHADVGPEVVSRFEREAVAAGVIDHPNVARATDFGRLPDGSFFLVLEYVAGRSLRKELEGGPLEPRRAIRIVRGIAAAVGAAHEKGVSHRDLKPENILLVDKDGDPDFVKVLDFGIAKVTTLAPEGGQILTRVGAVFGTPDYMSPEQALGLPVDERTDLYSLGVILFELLTGERPFRGGTVTVLRQHVIEEAPPLPGAVASRLDPRVGEILRRLLAKGPENRYGGVSELSNALDDVLAPAPRIDALARTEVGRIALPPAREPAPTPRRAWWVAAAVGIACAGGLVLCAVGEGGDGAASRAAAALDVPPAQPVVLPPPPLTRGADVAPQGSAKPAGARGGGDPFRSLGQKIRSLF